MINHKVNNSPPCKGNMVFTTPCKFLTPLTFPCPRTPPFHSVCYSTDLLPTFPQTLKQILFLCLHGFVLIQKFGRRHLNINVFSLCKRSSKSYRIRLIVVGVKLRVRANYRCTPAVYKMSRNDPKLGSKMVAFS